MFVIIGWVGFKLLLEYLDDDQRREALKILRDRAMGLPPEPDRPAKGGLSLAEPDKPKRRGLSLR